ncbi:uncharacterized protein TNCV_4473141 [Trichonephila clavipes]|uniref:Uncharacterized protein n=1 Tax=Trichonephila clavipes TaxID=2585209 RepID=A0A8X6SN03_TRICX|nr:uncharacterized protein TNCV_4473141 [Trichonephila clavipes]
MLTYPSPIRVVFRRIRGPYHANYHHRACISLNSPLLTCRVHRFMRFSPYPYTSISLIQLETRLVRPGNAFLVINNPVSVLMRPGEAYSFVSCSQQGTRMGLRLRKPISMTFH